MGKTTFCGKWKELWYAGNYESYYKWGYFTKVDLNWRNFKRVNYIGVDLIKANLKTSGFEGVNLAGPEFREVQYYNITFEQLSKVKTWSFPLSSKFSSVSTN